MKNIFTLPIITDDKDTQIARLLYVYLWTFILATSVMILSAIALPEITVNQLLLIGTVDTSSMLLLILASRGSIKR